VPSLPDPLANRKNLVFVIGYIIDGEKGGPALRQLVDDICAFKTLEDLKFPLWSARIRGSRAGVIPLADIAKSSIG